MRLRKCDYENIEICVWNSGNAEWKKYRIGSKKAIFLIDFLPMKRYTCEGCIRQLTEEGGIIQKKEYKIVPLTKRAKKILILLRL